MIAVPLPTLPTWDNQVGSTKAQQHQRYSDSSDTSDHQEQGEPENRGSLRNLVARWQAREWEKTNIDLIPHVVPSLDQHLVSTTALVSQVGSVGRVGIVPKINSLHASDLSPSESEVSEVSATDRQGDWDDEPGLEPIRTPQTIPHEKMVAGLLAGYRFRPVRGGSGPDLDGDKSSMNGAGDD